MEITYDLKSDAMNITFKEGRVFKTVKIAPEINFDLDREGNPLYLEIIGTSEKMGRQKVNEVLMKNLIPSDIDNRKVYK